MSDKRDEYEQREKELSWMEEAWGKAFRAFRTGIRRGHAPNSIRASTLLAVHQKLEARRRSFESGDKMALLHAVRICFEENVPAPTWLALAYGGAFDAYVSVDGTATSLDEVFGSSTMPTTEKRLAGVRQNWSQALQLYEAMHEVAAECPSFNAALDRVLATRDFGVGKSSAGELVLMIDKSQSQNSGGSIKPLSHFWPKSQKEMT